MISEEKFKDLIRYVRRYYPKQIRDETDVQAIFDGYYEFFFEQDLEVLCEAIKMCIKEKPFFPSVSEINSKLTRAEMRIEIKHEEENKKEQMPLTEEEERELIEVLEFLKSYGVD